MSVKTPTDELSLHYFADQQCECGRPAEIVMRGDAENGRDLWLCRRDALQLACKLPEDLCEVLTGDRHG